MAFVLIGLIDRPMVLLKLLVSCRPAATDENLLMYVSCYVSLSHSVSLCFILCMWMPLSLPGGI